MGHRTLYGYWRSSAAYRVRIALAWKGLNYRNEFVDLRNGAQSLPGFKALNPQGFVPYLVDGDTGLIQSLAIMEYLEEMHPAPPLLPDTPVERARVRAMAQVVACDIHPVNNLRIFKHLANPLGLPQEAVDQWARHWIASGFQALEKMAHITGPYLYGEHVTLADVCLVPQIYNARRVGTDLTPYPRLMAAEQTLLKLPAFAAARPEAQPDARPVAPV